ncbi:MAG: serine/threonine protein phosphatase [Alphaproteobacteria bacterium]|nr:serine/threonine protein phosphatase [Alphaproteobacteria bacterium]
MPHSKRYAPSPGTRLYAVGDIHGRPDLLEKVLARIAKDAKKSRAARTKVVTLGDYVDRGPDSRGVVQRLMKPPPEGIDELISLKGNHEDMLLRFLDHPLHGGFEWILLNGGAPTLASWGVDLPAILDSREIKGLHKDFLERLTPEERMFIANMPLKHVDGTILCVHAGIRPGIALSHQVPDDLLWIRDAFLDSTAAHGKLVVHGHTVTFEPELCQNRAGIDTGAWRTGTLTALGLEGDKRWILHT